MFKNPLKFQQGGQAPVNQQELEQMFALASQNTQIPAEQLIQKAQELADDQQAITQYMEAIQLSAQGDQTAIQAVTNFFTQRKAMGGKIEQFVCKHGKGGHVGCDCEKNGGIVSARKGTTVSNDGTYTTVVTSLGDTTRTKEYRYSTQEMKTFPNGNVRYRVTTGGSQPYTTYSWKRRPNLLQGFWYGNRIVNPDEATNWENIIANHPEDPRNAVKQKEGGTTPDTGTISQGQPRSRFSSIIDNNSKARQTVAGFKRFVNSPVVRWPLGGAAAYGAGKLIRMVPAETEFPIFGDIVGGMVSNMSPKFIKDTYNPFATPDNSTAFWSFGPELNKISPVKEANGGTILRGGYRVR